MIRTLILLLFVSSSFWQIGCTTTEQEVSDQIEILASNEIDSERWTQAVDNLVAIGRPAARELMVLLDPGSYKGKHYRDFRGEIEQTRTGAIVVLGRIKHKAASAQIHPLTAAGTYTFKERVASLKAVSELGFNQAAVNALISLFDGEKDPVIRLYTALTLVKLNEPSANGEIHDALAPGGDATLAQIAISELGETNYFGVPLLVDLLASDGPHQENLSSALESVEKSLIQQLTSDDPDIRMRSANALGHISIKPDIISALSALLDDPSNLVRFNAAAAMSRLGNEDGTDFLFNSMGSDDPILRANAIKSLVDVQQTSTTVKDLLIESLSNKNHLMRTGAAQVLGEAQVASAVPQLVNVINDSVSEVRCNVVIALGRIAAQSTREDLARLVDDDDASVAYYAEWALKEIEGSI